MTDDRSAPTTDGRMMRPSKPTARAESTTFTQSLIGYIADRGLLTRTGRDRPRPPVAATVKKITRQLSAMAVTNRPGVSHIRPGVFPLDRPGVAWPYPDPAPEPGHLTRFATVAE